MQSQMHGNFTIQCKFGCARLEYQICFYQRYPVCILTCGKDENTAIDDRHLENALATVIYCSSAMCTLAVLDSTARAGTLMSS